MEKKETKKINIALSPELLQKKRSKKHFNKK